MINLSRKLPLDPSLLQFAAPTIEGQVKRYFRDHCRPIRMPRSAQEDLALHQGAHSDLVQLLGREPTEAEIAAAAGSSVARVRSQRLASRVCQPVSADAPTASSLAWLRCDDSSRTLDRVDAAVSIGAAVRELPPRDRRILALRFVGELSQTEIAAPPIDPGGCISGLHERAGFTGRRSKQWQSQRTGRLCRREAHWQDTTPRSDGLRGPRVARVEHHHPEINWPEIN